MALDWDKRRQRAKMTERDPVAFGGLDSDALVLVLSQPSKAELRAEAEAALASYRGTVLKEITCRGCGRTAQVRVPLAKIELPFRCSRCGATA